jgi:hypothetical protein
LLCSFFVIGPVAVGDSGLHYVLCDRDCLTGTRGRRVFNFEFLVFSREGCWVRAVGVAARAGPDIPAARKRHTRGRAGWQEVKVRAVLNFEFLVFSREGCWARAVGVTVRAGTLMAVGSSVLLRGAAAALWRRDRRWSRVTWPRLPARALGLEERE